MKEERTIRTYPQNTIWVQQAVLCNHLILYWELKLGEKRSLKTLVPHFNAPIHFADRVAMIIAKGVNSWMEKETMRESYYMSNTLLLGIK
jgi:hypothetical protein